MSIFSKFFFTLFGSSILAWLRDFVSRVTGDGGTLSDQGHTKEVYADAYPYGPTLIQTCDSGGSTAQNFAVGSEDISNATYWLVANVTATSSAEPNPFGGSGVTLLAESGSSSAHGFYQQSAYQATVVSGQAYTASAYFKKGDGSLAPDIVQITHLSTNFGTNFYANYNINTGVVTKVNGGFADIEDVGSGWYRISLAGVATSSGSSGTFVFVFTNNDPNAARFPSYTGVVSHNVYVWGVQFVQGNEPGEYIKTTTAAIDSIGTLYSAVVNPQALLETFTGAAAAYSLRSLSASTTNVVKVRRSSDDTEQDFTAAEITDGTLLTFVNENVEKVLNGDFSNGSTNWTISNGSVTGGEYVSGTLSAYQQGIRQSLTFTGTGTLTFDLTLNSGSLRIDDGGVLKLATSSGAQSFTLTNPNKLEFNAYNLGFDGIIDNVSFIPTNVDGFVTTWYDQSGNGNNATQATAANQPKIVSSGSLITQGSKAAMELDGVNDCLVTSQNNPFTFTGGVSIIHASYKNSTSYDLYETIVSAGTAGDNPSNGTKSLGFGYGNSATSPRPTIATDIWQPSGIQYDGTVGTNERHLIGIYISNWSTHRSTGLSNLRLNGSDLATKSYGAQNPTSLNTNPIKIGVFDQILPQSFFGGSLQEVIIYASDQSAKRTGIEANINDYYNIYP